LRLSNGTYWTPLEKLYAPKLVSYKDGYKDICLRMQNTEWQRPQDYQHIVNDLKDEVLQNDTASRISLKSASTVNSETSALSLDDSTVNTSKKKKNRVTTLKPKQGPKKSPADCLGGVGGNKGHLIPKAKTLCAPRYGIIVQPIIGFSFEDLFKSKIVEAKKNSENPKVDVAQLNQILIKILQKSVISDKQPHGIASRQENLLYVPKYGHEDHFDNGCQWFFIPVMSLEDALNWTSGQEYKVMAIAGDLREVDTALSARLYQLLMPGNVLEIEDNCLLNEDEIRKATIFLQVFVKALADMATGRGENALTPDNLDRDQKKNEYEAKSWQEELKELKAGRASLEEKGVMVPDFRKPEDFSNVKVLGLTLKNGPDPALLGLKDGIGWMTQNGQRPLPACERSGEDSDFDEDEDSDFDEEDEDTGSMGKKTFQGITSTPEIPEFVCVHPVTTSPTRYRPSSRLSSSFSGSET
jgi:hypothetical protein